MFQQHFLGRSQIGKFTLHSIKFIQSNGKLPKSTMSISNQGKLTPTTASPSNISVDKNVRNGSSVTESVTSQLFSPSDKTEFMEVFPRILQDLTELQDLNELLDTRSWLKEVLEYNVPHGKQNRGMATVLAYRSICETAGTELTPENLLLSNILGWCVEMLQAFFLVYDDMMDGSETRRGVPCWYKYKKLDGAAFNDAVLINYCIYPLLKKYFQDKTYYVDLMEIMQDATFKTSIGQSLDTLTSLEKRMENYTMTLYSGIVKYKTSFYSYTLPLSLALAMAGITDAELKRQATQITLDMGHFFQVQDDYLDCFGEISITGKVGTDIQDCKCCWLFVRAKEQATPEQLNILLANYGQSDPQKIERVKKLYLEMGIPKIYEKYEEASYRRLSSQIQKMSERLPHKFFDDMLLKIYRRSS